MLLRQRETSLRNEVRFRLFVVTVLVGIHDDDVLAKRQWITINGAVALQFMLGASITGVAAGVKNVRSLSPSSP